jgi:hypothetical protein
MAEKCAFWRANASVVHAFLYKRDIGTKEPKGATLEMDRRSKPEFNGDRRIASLHQNRVGFLLPPATLHDDPSFPRRWGRFFKASRVESSCRRLRVAVSCGRAGEAKGTDAEREQIKLRLRSIEYRRHAPRLTLREQARSTVASTA